MYDITQLQRLFAERRPDHTLPQALYLSPEAYAFDLEAIFRRNWLLVGFVAELPLSGSYLATEIGGSPILIVRDTEGAIRAFHNSCRHRGAQICKAGSGRMPRLVCPYHQWSYSLTGKLLSARGADTDFDASTHHLIPIRVEVVAGCIYASLAADPPDIAPLRRALEPALKPYNLENLKVAHIVELAEAANWKLVMENGRECHHCAARHPEFVRAFPPELIDGGVPYKPEEATLPFMTHLKDLGFETEAQTGEWWQMGRIRMKEGFVTFSVDGKPLVDKPLVSANGGNLGTFRWAVEPNNFCHITSDCLFAFNATPTGPLTTTVTAKWLVHKDAVEGVDYQVDRLIHMWDQTNRQDRDLAENNQRGVSSVGYVPGPYSATAEPYVIRFVDWYCKQASKFLQMSTRAAAG